MAFPWILFSIVILILIFGVLAILVAKNRGKKHKPDYYTFFIMGVIWTAFGIIFRGEMTFFLIMGLAFLAIGLINKDKWKSNRRRWGDMDKGERKLMMCVSIILGILVLAGVVALFLVKRGII